MKKSLFWLVLLLITVMGCATPGTTTQQLISADYGTFPDNWKQITTDALANEMVRPDSLYIRKIDPPIKAWVVTPDNETIYGWGVCGLVVMGKNHLSPFFILIYNDNPIYKALGFNLAKRIPGKTWTQRGVAVKAYNCCPNLFK